MEEKDFFDNLEKNEKNKKAKCINCGKVVNDLEKGCTYCNGLKQYDIENYDNKLENIGKENNTIASILKVVSWIVLISSFILGIIISEDEFSVTLECLCIGSVCFIFTYALGEIIQILHDIRLKVWKK